MIEDIIYNRVNSKDIFYQVGDDTYTLQDLLITDLKDSFKDIKNKLIFEKMTIIKELDDVVNNLRAAYIIDHDNNMESDAYDQINDELTDSIKSYYDKHYFIENEEEIEESGNVISIVKLVRTNHNLNSPPPKEDRGFYL